MLERLWIKVSVGLMRHPKLRRLAQSLSESPLTSTGRLMLLWTYALEFYPNGKMNITAEELADICQWEGDPEVLVKALTTCGGNNQNGFIEILGEYYIVHDWADFSGELDKKREYFREYRRKKRADQTEQKQEEVEQKVEQELNSSTLANKKDDVQTLENTDVVSRPQKVFNKCSTNVQQVFSECSAIDTDTDTDTDKNQNRKNLSCPKRKTKREKSDENDDEKKALPFIEDFEAVWEIYPKKLDKKQAYNCYVARRRAGTSAEELYMATQNFAGEMKKQNRENRYIMSGKTFFGVNDRWLDYARPQTQATTPQLTGEEEYMRDALGAGLISSQQYDDWRRKHNGVQ